MNSNWLTTSEFLNFIKQNFKVSRSHAWAILMRKKGGGPQWTSIGSAVRYRQDWVEKWAQEITRGEK
jgi:hypothetical protein